MPTTPLSRLLYVSKALANRARLRILGALEGRELCVGQVAAIFDIARSTASEHLSVLRRVGLIGERRDGRFVWYSLDTDERAQDFLAVVLLALASDQDVRADRQMTGRILALPHDLVCEKGRAALDSSIAPAATAADPDSRCCPSSNSNTDPQEAP
jgi:DNA-binding transcriptional ArsR family regulator